MIKKILFPNFYICLGVLVATAITTGLIGATASDRTKELVYTGMCSVDWNDTPGNIEINCDGYKLDIEATNKVVRAMMNSETVKCQIFNTPTSPNPLSSKCEF